MQDPFAVSEEIGNLNTTHCVVILSAAKDLTILHNAFYCDELSFMTCVTHSFFGRFLASLGMTARNRGDGRWRNERSVQMSV
ncbi:MAG TPA: hypothetical protein DIT76_01715 [Spartobacteria bacterium]|nr:hypothetical protein [Spartobacteria bacterium]HCP90756.1 hypothetical protein [Spartobacteria bacterium]